MGKNGVSLTAAVVASVLAGTAGLASAQSSISRSAAYVGLATAPLVRPNTVQSVTRDGNSAGRATFRVQRGVIGGQPQSERNRLDWQGPGPAYYGAAEDDFRSAYVQRGREVFAISPWVSQYNRGGDDDGVNERLDIARQQWLRERGYIGAVRGVRNSREEAARVRAERSSIALGDDFEVRVFQSGDEITPERDASKEPAFILEVPAEATKFRHEMMVKSSDALGPITRISMPPAGEIRTAHEVRLADAEEARSEHEDGEAETVATAL